MLAHQPERTGSHPVSSQALRDVSKEARDPELRPVCVQESKVHSRGALKDSEVSSQHCVTLSCEVEKVKFAELKASGCPWLF